MKRHCSPAPSGDRDWSDPLLIGTVIAVTATLGALFVRIPLRFLFKAGEAKAGADIVAICSALDAYAARHDGHYPRTLSVLVLPDEDGHTLLNDLTRIPPDPWGTPYTYEPPAEGGSLPMVTSLGRDGQPGGTGFDADIDNITIRARPR